MEGGLQKTKPEILMGIRFELTVNGSMDKNKVLNIDWGVNGKWFICIAPSFINGALQRLNFHSFTHRWWRKPYKAVKGRVVVLESGLGLETGLETDFSMTRSRLGLAYNWTRTWLGLGPWSRSRDRSRPRPSHYNAMKLSRSPFHINIIKEK